MSVAIAEGYELGLEQEPYLHVVEQPAVVSLADLPQDEMLRYRTNRQIRSLGSVALQESVDDSTEQEAAANRTLLDAIKHGAEGDQEATAMVAVNVGSDFSERTLKTGEVAKYYLQKSRDGKLIQNGQLYTDVYANTIRHTPLHSKMRPRTEAETRNAARISFSEEQGLLKDNYAVVFSECEVDMTDKELEEANFFTKTKTLAMQATTAEGEQVSIESAFLAGVKEEGEERIDIETIVQLAAVFGVDYSGLNPAEIIDRPLLIPKELMPNGVIDLVEMYDDLAGGTFFGEAKPRQDYQEYREFCDERRKSFADDVRIVTNQLLAEANLLDTPYGAIGRLGQLSEAQMVKRAIRDTTMDTRVFGEVSASHIEFARQQEMMGNYQAAHAAEAMAIKTADSKTCPSGVSHQSEIDKEVEDKTESGEDSMKDCEFTSKKCPVCGEKNARTKVKKGKYYHIGKSCSS